MTDKTSLGDRMKTYEHTFRTSLPPRLPIILRLDGRAFHTYTRGCATPFDENLENVMNLTAIAVCKDIQGEVLAYVQSDEISVLIHGYKRFTSQPWFGGEIQKMVSVSAGLASATFTANSGSIWEGTVKPACFDSRVFVLPEADVCNYFVWRQQDFERNSVQMLARSLYSHKECHKKNNSDLQEMCFQKGKNWNDLPVSRRRGRTVMYTDEFKWKVDSNIPRFSQDRTYVEGLLVREDE